MYQIEKDIPIPSISHKNRPSTIYPLKQMEIGDSFFVPDNDKGKKSTVRSAVLVIAKRIGIKIVTRKVEGGLRVWRV